MKKNPANRSAFLQSRAMVAFATCAIAAFLTLLAYALAPGNRLQAAPQQQVQQTEAPALQQNQTIPSLPSSSKLPTEELNVAQGTLVTITAVPLNSELDQSLQRGMPELRPLPLPVEEERGNQSGIVPTQATATPTPAGAITLLDTYTGATVLASTATSNTYMGDGFTNSTLPGGTTYVSLRSYTFFMASRAAATYTDIHARVAFWNTYTQATSPVFANSSSFFDVDLGASTLVANTFYIVTITILPPYPFLAGGSGTQWGYAQNFQGNVGAGLVDNPNLTSLITGGSLAYAAGTITTGTSPSFAVYRNVSGLTNFNFTTGDSTAFAITRQAVGIQIRGDAGTGPTPTAAPTGTPGVATPTPTAAPTATPVGVSCTVSEGMDDITNLVSPKGWVMTNHSNGLGSTGWFQGSTAAFIAHSGAGNSYIGANYNNTGSIGTISNWLLTPPVTLQNGGILSFYTRTTDFSGTVYPDRLQVRYSTNGTSSNVGATVTDVGDFTNLVLDINPTLNTTAYPHTWTNFTVNLTGLGLPITGRFAFRYFVDGGGSAANNSDYIGIDTVNYTCAGPTPTPVMTATPAPTASPQPTGTPSPTCQPVITLSSSQSVVAGSVACPTGPNTYSRAFSMPGFTGGAAYNVTSVSFGIEEAAASPSPGSTQPVTVNLYTQNAGPVYPGGTKTLLATTTVNVPDQALTVFTAPLVTTVPAGTSQLIMEVFSATNNDANTSFYIGSNTAIEGGPTYLTATGCGIPTPETAAEIGFPDMHAVMNVNGSCVVATPTPPANVTISGKVGNCSSPNPTATPPAVPTPAVLPGSPNVVMTLTGSSTGSTLTDASGNYSFTVASGGSYTITPSKASIPPAGPNINNLDVLAIQRHFLAVTLIPAGCRLTAADANVNGSVNNQDVLAVQRFFLGFTSGTGSVGQYKFVPASRTYPSIGGNQTAQDYSMYVVGDAAAAFNNRPGMPENDLGFSNVATVALPQISAEQSKGNFTAPVTSSVVDKQDRIVGFQGDFTFDERVVTFATEPVQKAGLTGGNWNVSGNVLPGAGPIRTLRISAYSSDFAPLAGAGTLFELKVVNAKSGGTTPLAWAAGENTFLFMDADLNTQRPGNSMAGSVSPSSKR